MTSFKVPYLALVLFVSLSTIPAHSICASELTIMTSNTDSGIVLTDEDLQELPQVNITTDTPWTETAMTYQGPTLWSVLEKTDLISNDLNLVALNDYSIRLNSDRITQEWPIIARLKNGKPMSVREKGPYWLMFPFDENKELQTETFYALSIWQLSKIRALD
jgi:hypothetical protein